MAFRTALSRQILVVLAIGALAHAADLTAPAAYEGKTVTQIRFEPPGQPLAPPDLQRTLQISQGTALHLANVRAAIKRLYGTGAYDSIEADTEPTLGGVNLIFRTTSQWFVGPVEARGKIHAPPSRAQLATATRLELGAPLSDGDIDAAVSRLNTLLERNGLYRGTITPQVVRDSRHQQVSITFQVDSGKRARYTLPAVTGAPVIPAAAVAHAAKYKEILFFPWKPVTLSNTETGLQNIRNKYKKLDRLTASVALERSDYLAGQNRVRPEIRADGGPKVKIEADGAKIKKTLLKRYVPVYDEGTVNQDLLVTGARNLRDYFQNRGYFDVQVGMATASTTADLETITYKVGLGASHRVVKLTVNGNRYFTTAAIRERMYMEPRGFIRLRHGRYSQIFATRDGQARFFSSARPRITFAWPTESRPSRIKVCTVAGSFSRRMALATTARLLPTLSGDFLLRELELFGQLRVAVRFLDGVQVFALQIFDQREFQHRAVVGLADDDRDFRQLEELRRAPAAFAGDQFKKSAALAHDERLDDALFADGIGQFPQGLVGKFLARLERGGADAIQRHALHALAVVRRGRRRKRAAGWRDGAARVDGERRIAAQQCAQTASQCRFCHARRVSQGGEVVNLKRKCSLGKTSRKWFSNCRRQMKILLPVAIILCGLSAAVDSAFAQTWIQQTNAPITNLLWQSVASSADGSQIVAVGQTPSYPYKGPIYTSFDSGITWTSNSLSPQPWIAIASSADGTKLVTLARGGVTYASTNSGTSWTNSLPGANWYSVASSADGTKLVAAAGTGSLYTSTNSGNSWSAASGTSGMIWRSVASSADGTKLVAVNQRSGSPGGSIYTSTDSGNSWVSNNAPNLIWVSAASSADGNILAAASGGFNLGIGPICVSTNSGATWATNNSPIQPWGSVASSADGRKLIAAVSKPSGNISFSNLIFTSTDFGVTWTSNNVPAETWSSVASSADGNNTGGCNYDGGIWTFQTTPSPQLNLATSSTNLALSWLIPSTNFVVQQSPDLISWSSVTDAPALNLTNLNNELSLSPTNSSGFFRLMSQ